MWDEGSMDSVIHLAASINKSYLPYFSVMVSSVFRHRDPARRYYLHVLSFDVTESDLHDAVPYQTDSFKLSVLDVSELNKRLAGYHFGSQFGPECVFRLGLIDLLPSVDKVLYLDSDLVVLKDISALFDVDIQKSCLAAALDIGSIGMVSGYDLREADRLQRLGIDNSHSYFNSGVLLMNLSELRMSTSLNELLSWIVDFEPEYPDQDCLNRFFSNRTLRLSMRWNVLFDSEGIRVKDIAAYAPEPLFRQYLDERNDPSIFHFAGPYKPWMRYVDGSQLFWSEARFSPLYELVVANYACNQAVLNSSSALQPVWSTFDNLYFEVNEGERIRADLHRRLTDAERRIDELQASIDELKRLKTPLINKVYARIKN